eukprot:6189887-Pleurochrysis_carterae.AAC.7
MDVALPWANKVGGIVAGDERLFVGGNEYDGGVAGIAFTGVTMDSARTHARTLLCAAARITSTTKRAVIRLSAHGSGT